ncbi:hypothetical protein ACS0TY_023728 [Phlomoides rotata]
MCIHDHAIFVLAFLEYFPAKANRFEGPIMDVDNEAEDILEYFMWNQIHKPIMLDVGDELGIEFGAQMDKVFTNDQYFPPELEDIGKEIARGCRGLPLVVVLVAGILPTIAKIQLEKILYLSYTHLPLHLRPCFLYIGGFLEEYKIHASRLIKIFAAEEEAQKCLEDLVRRSLVLVTTKFIREIKSYSLHDVVRDSCIRKTKEEEKISMLWTSIILKKT